MFLNFTPFEVSTMMNDYFAKLADNLAYNGTPGVIDQGAVKGALGKDTRIYIQGHSLAGVTAVNILDGPTASPATQRVAVSITAANLNAAPLEIPIPSNCQRYLTVSFTGASAGTYDAWVCLENTQTNM
jgi:hypothetical protein